MVQKSLSEFVKEFSNLPPPMPLSFKVEENSGVADIKDVLTTSNDDAAADACDVRINGARSDTRVNSNAGDVNDNSQIQSVSDAAEDANDSTTMSHPPTSMDMSSNFPKEIPHFDPNSINPLTLNLLASIIHAATSEPFAQMMNAFTQSLSTVASSNRGPSVTHQTLFGAARTSSNINKGADSTRTTSKTNEKSNSLLPYVISKSSIAAESPSSSKKRINRGRIFKAHKGGYNVIIDDEIRPADYMMDAMKGELIKKQIGLLDIVIDGSSIYEKLSKTVDLLPHLKNPSYCGAVIAGHLFPRDFFINHILRDTDGNVKAAKGFINHSNRDPLSREASKLFFDVLYYFGGVIINPDMLESWMWVARKGVNDRGNTSKSGRNVRYFVEADYVPILQEDIWFTENSTTL